MPIVHDQVIVDALGPQGRYHARERVPILDVSGTALGELSLVPALFVTRAMQALRAAKERDEDDRLDAIARAGWAYLNQTVDGISAADYQFFVSRVVGMPISAVRSAVEYVANCATRLRGNLALARPIGSVNDWRDPLTRTGRGVWRRRGRVFAVLASGNHPAVHASWLEALALGFTVAVRPSRREPFTAYRLVFALRAAGFSDDEVVLLPTSHEVSDEILRGADLAAVYGGDDVVRRFHDRPFVHPYGPGRSKVLVTADVDWRASVELVVDSISHEAGMACANATAVFVEGDPAPLAEAIAERLSTLPSLAPEHERAVLPVQAADRARALERRLHTSSEGTVAWLGGGGIVDELGDGSAVLRPAVHQVDRADAAQLGLELPFPCAWVAPWSDGLGVGPLKNTLVLTAMTRREDLLEVLSQEPTIANLHIGAHPTYWTEPGMPHDGYLADFLMRTITVIRS